MAIEDSGRELWRNHYEGARTALSARLRQPHAQRNRPCRFGTSRRSDLLRRVFETVLRRFVREGLVDGENFVGGSSPTPKWTSTLRVNEYTALGASSNGKQQQA